MSKLSVASLFDAVHSLHGMHTPLRSAHRPAVGLHVSGGSAHSSLTKARATVDESIGRPLIRPADLAAALRQTFNFARDRVVSDVPQVLARPAELLGRSLRFDPDHVAAEPAAPAERDTRPVVVHPWAAAIGLAQARDLMRQNHWVVVLTAVRGTTASLASEQMQTLARLPKLLIVACEFEDAPSSPTACNWVLERLAADTRLTHVGPVAGLDLDGIRSVLEALKALEQPALLHLRLTDRSALLHATTNGGPRADGGNGHVPGNGHKAGNGHPAHVGPRRRRTVRPAPPAGLASWAVQHLIRAAHDDPATVIIDLTNHRGLTEAGRRLPGRSFAASPGDPNAWAWCAGLMAGGCRPLVVIDDRRLPEFLPRGLCLEEMPLRLLVVESPRDDRGADAGRDFGLSWLRQRRGLAILVPADRGELPPMLRCATARPGPVAICLPNPLAGARGLKDVPPVTLGSAVLESPTSADVLADCGDVDLALIAWGPTVAVARAAARQLSREGIDAAVVNLRSLEPLDETMVAAVMCEAPVALVVEGVAGSSGCFAPLCEALARRGVGKPPSVLFVPYGESSADGGGPRDDLSRVVERCRQLVQEPAGPREAIESLPPERTENPLSHQPHLAEDEREAIASKQFSPWLSGWIDEYSRVGQRGIYLWRWCLHGVELTTLPCVHPQLRADAADTKVLAGMLNVLFDDVADQQGNGELLNELLKITHQGSPDFRRFSPQDRAYADFTCRVWEAFWQRAARYPCFEVYRELLHYDLAQLFNTVRYSHLVNGNPYILNVVEHDDYSAQGMGLLSFATVDLTCTPDFPVHELGTLRQAIWHGQWMARIGNLISTWQREVRDRDYTSGVFARAVAASDVTVEQLLTGNPAEIQTAIERGGHEAHFLRRWRRHRAHLCAMQPHVSSVDLGKVAHGLERLLQTELVSRGRK